MRKKFEEARERIGSLAAECTAEAYSNPTIGKIADFAVRG